MPWIRQVGLSEATGPLRDLFEAARARAGRVFGIVQVMGLNPGVLRDSIAFYLTLMKGESPLSRAQRELLATVVSAELRCHYWTQSHADDLRGEVAATIPDGARADTCVHAVVRDWRSAPLSAVDRALCELAAKLTHRQQEMGPADLDALRALGLDDRAIHDAVQVIGYFNYITRVADALGVEPEASIREWGKG